MGLLFRDTSGAREATAPLDGLRAISFLWIFQVHLMASLFIGSPTERLTAYFEAEPVYADAVMRGHLAVDVFNVLSAFLAFSALLGVGARKKVPLSAWAVARVLRIAPVYFLFLAACLAIHLFAEPLPAAGNAWANFAFANNLLSFQDIFMPHTWTLALEIQFALVLLPLLAFVMAALDRAGAVRPFRLLASLAMVSLCARVMSVAVVALVAPTGLRLPMRLHDMDWFSERLPASATHFYSWVYLPPWSRSFSFVVGAVAAYAVARPPRSGTAHVYASDSRVLLALCVMFAAALPRLTSYASQPHYPQALAVLYACFHRAAFAAPLGLLLYWCVHTGERRRVAAVRALASFLSSRVWYPVSSLSFVAYLVHVLVIGGVLRAKASDEPITGAFVAERGLVALGVTLLVSLVVAALVERPLDRVRRRLVRRWVAQDGTKVD